MGCDIHVYTEAKRTVYGKEAWRNVDRFKLNPYFGTDEDEDGYEQEYTIVPIYRNRNYELFAYLADVRNYGGNKSFGFDRGLPDDVSAKTKSESDFWDCDGHTHGYCTLKELKEAASAVKKVRREGAVSKEEAERFRNTGETPTSWARGIGCWHGIAERYQDQYEWMVWEDECHCFDELIKAIEDRKREEFFMLDDDGSKDDDIRIVFWFDN